MKSYLECDSSNLEMVSIRATDAKKIMSELQKIFDDVDLKYLEENMGAMLNMVQILVSEFYDVTRSDLRPSVE